MKDLREKVAQMAAEYAKKQGLSDRTIAQFFREGAFTYSQDGEPMFRLEKFAMNRWQMRRIVKELDKLAGDDVQGDKGLAE